MRPKNMFRFSSNVGFKTNEREFNLPCEEYQYKMTLNYEGESNENRKFFFKFNLLNESGTQLYHFST
jgi:hypothetical protein